MKFCLSYDFIVFKMNTISIGKLIVDTDIVSGVTCTCQSVITHVVIRSYDTMLSTNSDIIF